MRRFLRNETIAYLAIAMGIMALAPAAPVEAQKAPNYQRADGSYAVSSGVFIVNRGVSTSAAGTIATANAFQTALAANSSRLGCVIYNTSAVTEFVFLGPMASATLTTSIPLPAGGSFNCASYSGLVLTDQISITSATAASAYLAVSQ